MFGSNSLLGKPPLSISLSASTAAATYIFTTPTCRATIITRQPCKNTKFNFKNYTLKKIPNLIKISLLWGPHSLNAEFQHFTPRSNKISILWRPHSKRGFGGERRPKDRVKTWWL
jgi:hypothetical protein